MCTKDRLDYHWNIIFKETLARSSFVFPASAKLCKISYPYVFHMRVLEFLDTSFIHVKSIFEIVIFLKKKGIIHDLRHGRKCTKKDLCFVWINFFSSFSFSLLLLQSNHLCSNNPSLVMEPNINWPVKRLFLERKKKKLTSNHP